MQHDSLHAEYVAEFWHKMGFAFSIAGMVSGVGIVFLAGVGAYWHKWAVDQHRNRIEHLKEIN